MQLVRPKDVLLSILFLTAILALIGQTFRLLNPPHEVEKAWILPQSLYSSLDKQRQLVSQAAKNGSLGTQDVLKIATSSSQLKGEAIMIDDREVWLSTGQDGTVVATIPKGKYSVEVLSIPKVDIRGVPTEVDLRASYQMRLGFTEGGGKVIVIGSVSPQGSPSPNQKVNLSLKLFNDKNKNGTWDSNEKALTWAGVIVVLRKK